MDFEQLNQRLQKLSNEVDIRKAKIDFLKENGINPYREDFVRTHTIKETLALDEGAKVKICGRIIFRRIMGKFGFAKIQDIDGAIQVSVGRNEIEESEYDFYKKLVDVGDFIGVEGELYRTQTGELTVRAHKVELLSKAMRPLPEKFHGLTDVEAKYRQRYLDIIMNEKSREVFKARSKVESLVRRYLEDNGFTEIETPVLRVFELGKDFRNEGMDPTHLQEFTQVEWYASFWRFEDNITFFQELVKKLLIECIGTLEVNYQGNVINFGGEWERIDYVARLREILGFDFMQETDLNEFKKKVVQEYLDGKGGYAYIAKQNGIPAESLLRRWVNAYKKFGDEGLLRSRKNKNYSFQFKLFVVELYLTSEVSYQELALSQGINNPSLLVKWVNDFRISGTEALRPKKKGRKKTLDIKEFKKPSNPIEVKSVDTSAEHVKELEDELLKLRIENAYLKELRRLRLEEETLLKKQRESSTVSEDSST